MSLNYMQQLATFLSQHSTFFPKFEIVEKKKTLTDNTVVYAVEIDTGVMQYGSDWHTGIDVATEQAANRALCDSRFLAYYDD